MQLFLLVEYIERFINGYFRDNYHRQILHIYLTDMTIIITIALMPHQWIFSLQFRTTNFMNLLSNIAIKCFYIRAGSVFSYIQ